MKMIQQYTVDRTSNLRDKALSGHVEALNYPAHPIHGRVVRPYVGNAMTYHPSGKYWLRYGQGTFSSSSGQFIGVLGTGVVELCTVKRPDSLIVVTPGNPRQISALQLDTTKFP